MTTRLHSLRHTTSISFDARSGSDILPYVFKPPLPTTLAILSRPNSKPCVKPFKKTSSSIKLRPNRRGACLCMAEDSGPNEGSPNESQEITPSGDAASFEMEAPRESLQSSLLIVAGISKLGHQAWLFATPFFLLAFKTNSLVAPACFGISKMVFQSIMAPGLGNWMDNQQRLSVMFLAAAVQVASLCGFLTVAFFLSTCSRVWLFGFICVLGAVEALGALLMDVAISRDWLPTLFGGEYKTLNDMNTQLARVDLAAEVVAPLTAGAVIQALGSTSVLPVLLFGILRILCLIPQFTFFKSAVARDGALNKRAGLEISSEKSATLSLSLFAAWGNFIQHKNSVQLITLSYALVYLTVLSPHGLVLTAFLSTKGLSPAVLSVFRSSGALIGVLGVTAFQWSVRKDGLESSTFRFISFQALCAVAAAVTYAIAGTSTVSLLYFFMLFVALARFGLYGFEVGALQLQQTEVDQAYRGAIGTVEKSLCYLATLVMYTASLFVTTPATFTFIVWASAAAICAAAATFFTWRQVRLGSHNTLAEVQTS